MFQTWLAAHAQCCQMWKKEWKYPLLIPVGELFFAFNPSHTVGAVCSRKGARAGLSVLLTDIFPLVSHVTQEEWRTLMLTTSLLLPVVRITWRQHTSLLLSKGCVCVCVCAFLHLRVISCVKTWNVQTYILCTCNLLQKQNWVTLAKWDCKGHTYNKNIRSINKMKWQASQEICIWVF